MVTTGVLAVVALVVVGAALLRGADAGVGLMLWAFAAAMVAGAVVLAVHARPRVLALRRVAEQNPEGAVLLARRQPAVVSDLAAYLGDSDIYDDVSDRWVVASIDHRGLAAWSVGREPRELVLMRVKVDASTRAEVMQMCDIFRAKIIDVQHNVLGIEITGNESKLDKFLMLMSKFGISEITRTGRVALARKPH